MPGNRDSSKTSTKHGVPWSIRRRNLIEIHNIEEEKDEREKEQNGTNLRGGRLGTEKDAEEEEETKQRGNTEVMSSPKCFLKDLVDVIWLLHLNRSTKPIQLNRSMYQSYNWTARCFLITHSISGSRLSLAPSEDRKSGVTKCCPNLLPLLLDWSVRDSEFMVVWCVSHYTLECLGIHVEDEFGGSTECVRRNARKRFIVLWNGFDQMQSRSPDSV